MLLFRLVVSYCLACLILVVCSLNKMLGLPNLGLFGLVSFSPIYCLMLRHCLFGLIMGFIAYRLVCNFGAIIYIFG